MRRKTSWPPVSLPTLSSSVFIVVLSTLGQGADLRSLQFQAHRPPIVSSSRANTASISASPPPAHHDPPHRQTSLAGASTSGQTTSMHMHHDRRAWIQARPSSPLSPRDAFLSDLDQVLHRTGSNKIPLAPRNSPRSSQTIGAGLQSFSLPPIFKSASPRLKGESPPTDHLPRTTMVKRPQYPQRRLTRSQSPRARLPDRALHAARPPLNNQKISSKRSRTSEGPHGLRWSNVCPCNASGHDCPAGPHCDKIRVCWKKVCSAPLGRLLF